jgi:hypothetical protein
MPAPIGGLALLVRLTFSSVLASGWAAVGAHAAAAPREVPAAAAADAPAAAEVVVRELVAQEAEVLRPPGVAAASY